MLEPDKDLYLAAQGAKEGYRPGGYGYVPLNAACQDVYRVLGPPGKGSKYPVEHWGEYSRFWAAGARPGRPQLYWIPAGPE